MDAHENARNHLLFVNHSSTQRGQSDREVRRDRVILQLGPELVSDLFVYRIDYFLAHEHGQTYRGLAGFKRMNFREERCGRLMIEGRSKARHGTQQRRSSGRVYLVRLRADAGQTRADRCRPVPP